MVNSDYSSQLPPKSNCRSKNHQKSHIISEKTRHPKSSSHDFPLKNLDFSPLPWRSLPPWTWTWMWKWPVALPTTWGGSRWCPRVLRPEVAAPRTGRSHAWIHWDVSGPSGLKLGMLFVVIDMCIVWCLFKILMCFFVIHNFFGVFCNLLVTLS